jgi:hypothetical protein
MNRWCWSQVWGIHACGQVWFLSIYKITSQVCLLRWTWTTELRTDRYVGTMYKVRIYYYTFVLYWKRNLLATLILADFNVSMFFVHKFLVGQLDHRIIVPIDYQEFQRATKRKILTIRVHQLCTFFDNITFANNFKIFFFFFFTSRYVVNSTISKY